MTGRQVITGKTEDEDIDMESIFILSLDRTLEKPTMKDREFFITNYVSIIKWSCNVSTNTSCYCSVFSSSPTTKYM